MSDFEDAVKGLLSSPEGMSNILSLIGGLKGSAPSEGSISLPEQPAMNSPLDLSALKGIDPKIISSAMKILGEYTSDDDRIKLLMALKPHLNSDRKDRIDKAAKIMRITKSIHTAMNTFGGGGKDV